MKALSIHQPWAWAILHATKDIENRSWRTNYRGPLLIHASKSKNSFDAQDRDEWLCSYGVILPHWDELVKGALLGIVDLVDCLPAADARGSWVEGPWCWKLTHPRPFATPIPYRGAQQLFEVPDRVIERRAADKVMNRLSTAAGS